MSQNNSIFILNEQGLIEINKPEVREHPAFKVILEKDKGSVGDADGRKKSMAKRELLYIYLIADPRSVYYNLSLTEKRRKAKIHATLPQNWIPDEAVVNALLYYEIHLKLDSTANAYLAAEKNLYNTAEDIHDMQNDISELKRMCKETMKQLTAEGTNVFSETEKLVNIDKAIALYSQIQKLQLDASKIIKELPAMTKVKNDLAAAYAEAGGELKLAVGGREVGNRED
jgi:hypothetical protein